MLQAWRLRAGLEPAEADCSVERFDCVDLDSLIASRMRPWYLDLLDRADSRLLGPPASDVASLLTVTVSPCGYEAVVTPHQSLRRLVALRLDAWTTSASVADLPVSPAVVARQSNRFARATADAPLVWRLPDGSYRAVPARADSLVVAASGYVDPGPELYVLDEYALTLIPDIFKLIRQ